MCCSVASSAAKAEDDSDIPEDPQPSAEEEEQLQKKMGKEKAEGFIILFLTVKFF